jgi:glycerol-3-phosphate dehydrogenase (NAD(P)+)
VVRLAERLGIEMPITQAVDAILHRNEPAAAAVEQLLSRAPKTELGAD